MMMPPRALVNTSSAMLVPEHDDGDTGDGDDYGDQTESQCAWRRRECRRPKEVLVGPLRTPADCLLPASACRARQDVTRNFRINITRCSSQLERGMLLEVWPAGE